MTNSRLLEFDLRLSDYVRGNVLGQPGGQRYELALRDELDEELFDALCQEDGRRQPLTDDKLYELEAVAFDLFDRFRLTWEPYETLHRRNVFTVAEVREKLTRQSAENWSEQCNVFASRLGSRQSLGDGIAVVRDWVNELRRLQHAIEPTRMTDAGEPGRQVDASRSDVKTERLLVRDEVSLNEAAALLGCDRKTVLKFIEDEVLDWRNAAPPSSTRRQYRIPTRSVVALRGRYQRGGIGQAAPSRRPRSRRSRSRYKPQHISLDLLCYAEGFSVC